MEYRAASAGFRRERSFASHKSEARNGTTRPTLRTKETMPFFRPVNRCDAVELGPRAEIPGHCLVVA
jgi:hypothetical protein